MLAGLVLLINVGAATILTILNKLILLDMRLPSSPAALTFFHYCATCAFLKVLPFCPKPVNSELIQSSKVKNKALVLITFIATLGVASGNLALKLGSVAFHQTGRLISLPLGVIADYVYFGKKHGIRGIACVSTVAVGVFNLVAEDGTATLCSVTFLLISVACTIFTASAIKHTCRECNITALGFATKAAPWGAFFAGLLWLVWSCFDFNTPGEVTEKQDRITSTRLALMLTVDCSLAIVVNVTSTWCANCFSLLTYAVVGHSKTLITIALSKCIFDVTISFRNAALLLVSLTAAAVYLIVEKEVEIKRSSEEKETNLHEEFLLQKNQRG
jgi:solute carrier family 35, member E3